MTLQPYNPTSGDPMEHVDPVRPPPPDMVIQEQPAEEGPPCTRNCDTCGQDYMTPMVWHVRGHWMEYGRECPACAKVRMSGVYAATNHAKKLLWEKVCTPGYRQPERVAAVPKQITEWLKETMKHHPRDGILLSGPTGTFKTTAILNHAVRRLIFWGHKPVCITAMTFREQASKHAKDGRMEGWLREFRSKPWILFDDFGNGADTQTALEALHVLTEYRRSHNLPMLVTTQFTELPVMMERFKSNRTQGEAIIQRLKTLCPHRLDVSQFSTPAKK